MTSFHFLDWAVVAGYFAIVLTLGRLASRGDTTGEGFFLAGRKLGKVYQFFLNFGNSADATGAVSTSSVVYQQGASGVWVSFQMIFLNPYYWFMYPWFRRVRLTTMADLFVDRLGSRKLASFYATFQIITAVAVTMGFGNLVSYKISSALVTKEESSWTAMERQSVANYQELKTMEKARIDGSLPADSLPRLQFLQERQLRGELSNYVSALDPWWFYIIYTVVVGLYITKGGLAAAAINEAFQGILIVIFSIMLIPAGLAAIGGWDQLAVRLPDAMFNLFGTSGSSEFTGWTVAAIFFVTLMQTHALPGNMAIAGSARNEFAARFGAVTGTFGKRLTTIMWAFCGLIAMALFAGPDTLADPDMVWGAMSRQLLGPGLLGLMFAGILAAQMSTIAAQAMAASALFARNIYGAFRPGASDTSMVTAGRFALIAVLAIGVVISLHITDVYEILKFTLTMNVPFGATILLIFIWRRLTLPAVWTAVCVSAVVNILFPLVAHKVPGLATHPALVARTSDLAGRPMPVFFESVVRTDLNVADSPLVGRGRLHTELVILNAVGVDVVNLTPGGRLAGRFFVDALLPIMLLFSVSLVTRRPPKEKVDQFFGKMKTPVADTPELDVIAVEETARDPHRLDHTKLMPGTSWEFTRWNRVDVIGFAVCTVVTIAIIALFWGLLRLAAG